MTPMYKLGQKQPPSRATLLAVCMVIVMITLTVYK